MISIGKETGIPNTPYMNGTPHRLTIACILPYIFRLLVWNLATLVFLFSLTLPACVMIIQRMLPFMSVVRSHKYPVSLPRGTTH